MARGPADPPAGASYSAARCAGSLFAFPWLVLWPEVWPRTSEKDGKPYRPVTEIVAQYEASGGMFIEHDGPAELLPGVWITGPVPRIHPEKNYPPGVLVKT